MTGRRQSTFCTVITKSHLPYALTLYDSLASQQPDVLLSVLVVDQQADQLCNLPSRPSVILHGWDEVCDSGVGQRLRQKHVPQDWDGFRWSLKPVFMLRLLRSGFDMVVFVDADVAFFGDFGFLLEDLEEWDILLTPHWRSSDPQVDEKNFALLFTEGLFNGGFLAANRAAEPALTWWARACEWSCEIDSARGRYVDQTYLNLLPVLFDRVKILKHKGCNVANWNRVECSRCLGAGGRDVLIEGSFPVVFVHFTRSTIHGIESGQDPLLRPHLEWYKAALRRNGWPALEDQPPYGCGIERDGAKVLRLVRKSVDAGLRRIELAARRYRRWTR